MALLTITEYSLEHIDPNNSVNTLLPSYSGVSLPVLETAQVAMGRRMRLVLDIEISGNYPNGDPADFTNAILRYNPGLFTQEFAQWLPVGTFPTSGYTAEITDTSLGKTYIMGLSMINPEFIPENENGFVYAVMTDSNNLKIYHYFMVIADKESFINGHSYDVTTVLSKGSVYSDTEYNNDRTSVYNTTRAINCIVAIMQNGYSTIAPQFRIATNGKFMSIHADFTLETLSRGVVESVSPYEDTKVTIDIDDASHMVVIDEATLVITRRSTDNTNGNFEKELSIDDLKLVTTASTSTVSKYVKGPITYSQPAGKTRIEFYIDHTAIELNTGYDFHIVPLMNTGPSVYALEHALEHTASDNTSPRLPINVESRIYSRNGNSGENFTATVMERLSFVFKVDAASYGSDSLSPYGSFNADVRNIRFVIEDGNGENIFSSMLTKVRNNPIPSTGVFNSNSDITVMYNAITNEYIFAINDMRVCYLNNNNLLDMGGKTYKCSWSILLHGDNQHQLRYVVDSMLNVNDYDNIKPSDKTVYNLQFLDPETGQPISSWCDATHVVVRAEYEESDFADNVGVVVFVDGSPFGAEFKNNYGLREHDNNTHSLPSYVDLSDYVNPNITGLTVGGGVISFVLDISSLTTESKQRISVMAYNFQ